jgi:hypothetical protein
MKRVTVDRICRDGCDPADDSAWPESSRSTELLNRGGLRRGLAPDEKGCIALR